MKHDRFFRRAAGLLACGLIANLPTHQALAGQCPETGDISRPRIGLVLGGGGARGGAHVGVLKFLEEHRIPVDMIAGTSMGAIIGGLYSAGMTARDIESVMTEADWASLFIDASPRSQRTLRRKTDDSLSLFGPKLGVGKDSALLPVGAVGGQKIGLLLEELVSGRTRVEQFDDLPIPYRAVAADLVTGNLVLLESGQLSEAMRASMSVPGAFDPVRKGDMLLVDGGIVSNVPVDIARDMGADVIIAVNVSMPELSASELDDLVAVISQLTTLMVSSNTEQQIATLTESDVLLEPALGTDFSSADFERIHETPEVGYAAAAEQVARLQAFALDPTPYAAWRERIENCTSLPPTVQFVRLENNSRFSDAVLQAKISIRPGDPIDHAQLKRDLAHIHGLGFIRHANYKVVDENGATGIVIEVEQDARGTNILETGLGISGDGRGTNLDLRLAFLKTDLTPRGAEFRSAMQLGSDFGLSAEVYLPLDDRLRWIIQPELFTSRRELLVFDDRGNPLVELDIDEVGGQFQVGREFGRHAGIFAGASRYAGEISVNIGDPAVENFRFNGGDLSVLALYDRLDDLYMPSTGSYVRLEYINSMEALGADDEFEQFRGALFAARSWGQHTFWLSSHFNSTLDDDAPVYGLFTGGGFLSMSGFERDELIGQHFGFSLLGYRYRIGQSGLVPAYVGTTIEYGNAGERRGDVYGDGILNGSFYLGYNSPIGPLYLGFGWNEEQSGLLFLRLGSVIDNQSIGRR